MPTSGGALAIQHIQQLIRSGHIREAQEETLQPASLDLSISSEIYRMRGTFLPRRGEKIRDLLKTGMLFPTSLNEPLELNGIYLIRLNEIMDLPIQIYGHTNNKSSTGRINLQTRLIVNGVPAFDYVPRGYRGELWLEVIPKSFPVKLSYAERLNQMMFFTTDSLLNSLELADAHKQYGLLRTPEGDTLPIQQFEGQRGVTMHIDLSTDDIIGYRCGATTTRMLDYSRRDHDPLDFFQPIHRPKDGQLVMRRDEFYILVTKDCIRVPADLAVEMQPYDVTMGEFRSHYAGFFDPGFGYGSRGETLGSPAVLEVFTHDQDFVLRDGQPVCQMLYYGLTAPAEVAYGDPSLTNNYYRQTGPRLSKHFVQNDDLSPLMD